MYFCPRKNGPVEERVQLFLAIHLKLATKIQKVKQFFQQQKCLVPDCTKHRLLKFGFKRNVVKENDF
jgi:hypothetical protein